MRRETNELIRCSARVWMSVSSERAFTRTVLSFYLRKLTSSAMANYCRTYRGWWCDDVTSSTTGILATWL